jgi:two-component system, sensor histidine kinase PhcS
LTVDVHRAAGANAGQVGITFRDIGPGLAPENLGRLFEPFYTTKSTGLGLGLSICHDIIQRHRGQMIVERVVEPALPVEPTLPSDGVSN